MPLANLRKSIQIREPAVVEAHRFRTAWFSVMGFFLLSRVLYLVFLNPYFFAQFHYEELYRGLIGYEFWQGINFPLLHYRPDDYSGAWLVMGTIISLFFRILGPTVFSLKLVALLFSTMGFYFWFRIIWDRVGKQAALYFSTLFIFAPPFFINYTLTPMGDFAETIFFTGAAFHFFLKILSLQQQENEGGSKKGTTAASIAMGLLLGLGTWFNYFVGFAAISILLFWPLADSSFFRRRSFYFGCVSALIGFLPWFYMQTFQSINAFEIHNKPLSDHFGFHYLLEGILNYRKFIGFNLAESFGPGIWGLSFKLKKFCMIAYSSLLFLPVLGLGILMLSAPSERRDLLMRTEHQDRRQNSLALLVIYTGLVLIALQFSDFRAERFFIPIFPALFCFAAFSFEKIQKYFSIKKAILITAFIITTATLSLATNAFAFSINHFGGVFNSKGYSYQFVDSSVCKDIRNCLTRYSKLQNSLSPEDLHEFSTVLAAQISYELDQRDVRGVVRQLSAIMPGGFEPYFYYFLGREIIERKQSIYKAFRELRFLKQYNPYLYDFAVRGIIEGAGSANAKDLEYILDEIDSVPLEYFWRALGQRKASKWTTDSINLNSFRTEAQRHLREVADEYRSVFLQGIGKHLYDLWSRRPLNPRFKSEIIEQLPSKYHKHVFEGIGMAMAEREFNWQIANKDWYWKEFSEPINSFNQFHIQAGKKSVVEMLSN